MNRLTRKTNEKDFVSKESCYYLYEDEDTKENFLEKYPYAADQWPRWIDINAYISKLGRFEDLEEQLGCPLEVVFEALEKGIEYEIGITTYDVIGDTIPTKRLEKRKNIKEIKLKKYIDKFAFFVPYDYSISGIVQNDIVYLKDYGKTWFLKGEKCD